MAKIKIDKEKCKGCKLCILYCPNSSLVFANKLNKRGVEPADFKKGAKCDGCTLCALICPDCAIEIEK
ncbi:4Fe-4S binding protein [Candidatus Omnitrophota bacterium]